MSEIITHHSRKFFELSRTGVMNLSRMVSDNLAHQLCKNCETTESYSAPEPFPYGPVDEPYGLIGIIIDYQVVGGFPPTTQKSPPSSVSTRKPISSQANVRKSSPSSVNVRKFPPSSMSGRKPITTSTPKVEYCTSEYGLCDSEVI